MSSSSTSNTAPSLIGCVALSWRPVTNGKPLFGRLGRRRARARWAALKSQLSLPDAFD
eukprot:CAMPEP_0198705472 /NCGR_PEP_ID=MMETSP1468-20131203/390446_1 /TAXON_ID=1461545 /ORGANISM="Mantoniella sp, Strain CCMP1436" /LENGTH=57 /DNA_ID=CAMNT_0044464339 /DNA_START=516 /DNA_END=689 /DNA_ORIENTATION=-